METELINGLGDQLYHAMTHREVVDPLTTTHPEIDLNDAYGISQRLLSRRLEAGERLIGKKIGVTSHAVQQMLNVHQPDFGFLTDVMQFEDGADMPIGERLIQPRAEGEIAFVLKSDIQGPGVTAADVLAATDKVYPCFEVVDSRVRDWKIRIQDTVADNASCGLFSLGRTGVDPRDVDLTTCGMVLYKNGKLLSTGAGAAALGSPVSCVAWLANTLGHYGLGLKAGEVILSGSLVPLEPVVPGDEMVLQVGGIGGASVRFV
jgi:2-oxopent-4-enoate/cis-2-oxohex-4-enoate hydratase